MRDTDGEGRGGEGRALLGAREPGFGAASVRSGLRGAEAGTCAPRVAAVRVPGRNPHFRIWGRATEDGKPRSWAGGVGRRGVFLKV